MSALKNFSIQALVTRDYGELVISIPQYQFRYSEGISMKHMTLLALETQFYCSHLYVALMSCQCNIAVLIFGILMNNLHFFRSTVR